MNASKVVLAVLGGVAAGALIGVLMAPDKGSNTRKKYLDKGKNCIDDLKGKFEDLYDNAISDAKDFVSKEIK